MKVTHYAILTLLCLIITQYAWCQTELSNAVFTKTSTGLVVVNYDITNSSPGQTYFVELKYFSQQYQALTPKYVSGDIKQVTGGEGKKILWNYLNDGITHSAPINCELSLFKSGQAGFGKYFLSSTLFPGLGSYKITNSKAHLLHGIFGYGILACAAYLTYKVHKDNRDYKRNPSTAKYYSVRREKRVSYLMWGIGAQMWLNGYIDLLTQSKGSVKGFPIMKISGVVE